MLLPERVVLVPLRDPPNPEAGVRLAAMIPKTGGVFMRVGFWMLGLILVGCGGTTLSNADDPSQPVARMTGSRTPSSSNDAGARGAEPDASSTAPPDAGTIASNPDAETAGVDSGANGGSPDAEASAPDADETPPDAGEAAPDADTTPDAQPTGIDLTGVWAVQIVSSQIIHTSIVGDQPSRVVILMRGDVAHSGVTAMATIQFCDINVDPVGGVTVIYPQAAVSSIGTEQFAIALSNNTVGASFTTQSATQLLGWRSMQPATDPLPTSDSDPRVFDPDGDGHPGVTIQTTGLLQADLYMVNRTTVALDGTVMSADLIAGLNATTITQVILGSTSFLVPNGPIDATTDPNANASTFTLVRLTGSNSCADIVAHAGTLFP
jgi:hypothetical protein